MRVRFSRSTGTTSLTVTCRGSIANGTPPSAAFGVVEHFDVRNLGKGVRRKVTGPASITSRGKRRPQWFDQNHVKCPFNALSLNEALLQSLLPSF